MMKKNHIMGGAPDSGNILFLILIAVALFAALSYVASQTLRSGNPSAAKDNNVIAGSEIIQYATGVAQAITRMKVQGVDPAALCFDAEAWGHNDYDHAGCSDPHNQVFGTAPGAGGITISKPPATAGQNLVWYISGQSCVPGLGTHVDDDCNTDGDASSEDIIMFLPGVSLAVCQDINKRLGITGEGAPPPVAAGDLYPAGLPEFAGTFADGGRVDSGGSDMAVLRGKNFGCVEGAGTPPAGTYVYFHVLMPR